MSRPFHFALPILLAGALLTGPAFAQTVPAAPPPAAAEVTKAHPAVEKRIADLRATLKITPDQSRAFDDFAGVMRDNANRMDTLMKDQGHPAAAPSAVDQMKGYETVAQAHAEDMQKLVPAFSRLYDALSPEQKKLADQSFHEYNTRRTKRA